MLETDRVPMMSNLFDSASVAAAPPISDTLSSREIEVLQLMADGLTTKDIAATLGIAFKTAACHRYRIMQKLYATSTVTAVRIAIRQGLVRA